MPITRRRVLTTAAAAGGMALSGFRAALADGETESYGLSTFGDLAMPADFKRFDYVNPAAPKGGVLSLMIGKTTGNQNGETFDNLNIYIFKGDGAPGMDNTFDALMGGSLDEPDAAYGLVAKSARWSADKLTYKFLLRPEARFHDGSRITAKDVAWSLMTMKTIGHPAYRVGLADLAGVDTEGDDVFVARLAPTRTRDLHLVVASLPIFSSAWYEKHEFDAVTLEPPLGSGPYKVSKFEQGRFIEFERVKDYWAKDLPLNVGQNNFDRLRFECYRERLVEFEDFKAGKINYHLENTARFWATLYDFPAIKEGRVKREEIPDPEPKPTQGWIFNLRRPQFADRRVREAINYCFDYEWTSKNIMYNAYDRMRSYFQGGDLEAKGPPGPEELALLEPFRGKVDPSVFGEPWTPPSSDGSGSDRNNLRKADELLRAAGCKRDGGRLLLPDGKPFKIEFLDSSAALQPHTTPFIANLKKLGVDASSRIVDSVQFKRRRDLFDFDMMIYGLTGSATPGIALLTVFSSQEAKREGSQNVAGYSDPAIDALLAKVINAATREELTVACRALDRVLRAGVYWVPMWTLAKKRLAVWDVFGRPERQPKFDSGAPGSNGSPGGPGTWWFDADKAKKIDWRG